MLTKPTIATLQARIAELESENAALKVSAGRKVLANPGRLVTVTCATRPCGVRESMPAAQACGWVCAEHAA